jgi:prepilin-type N-terminal cleavage/methylation domain-containing protein
MTTTTTRTRDGGFTLTELMVVVVILGVMAGGALIAMKRDPVGEGARSVAALLQEARRLAIRGGPAQIASTDCGALPRAKVELVNTGGLSYVNLWVLQENTPPVVPSWIQMTRVSLPKEVELYAATHTAAIDPGTNPSALGESTTFRCYFANGSLSTGSTPASQGLTVYLRKRNAQSATDGDRFRIVVLRMSGIPTTVMGW